MSEFRRGKFVVGTLGGYAVEIAEDNPGGGIVLSRDEARWLAFVALPAALHALGPEPQDIGEGTLRDPRVSAEVEQPQLDLGGAA
jgi:hypothetical protein